MKIVILNNVIIAIHQDEQQVTPEMYPGAIIKKIINTIRVDLGDPDPTLEHPEYLITMKLFLHTAEKVRIVNEPYEFSCIPEAFSVLEPGYSGLSEGMTSRYWTPETAFVSDGVSQFPDPEFSGLAYCDNVTTYQVTMPTIYCHVNLNKTLLLTVNDSISVSGHIKATTEDTDPDLPIGTIETPQIWPIKLRNKDGVGIDSILVDFINGAASFDYIYREGLPLGDWYLSEQDFGLVPLGDIAYQVKLAHPVTFTISWRP